jgi:signal transduction histidine kinase
MLTNLIQLAFIKKLLDKDKQKIGTEVDESETVNLLHKIIQDKKNSIQKLREQINESGEVIAKLRKEVEDGDARLNTILESKYTKR